MQQDNQEKEQAIIGDATGTD